MEGKTAWEVGAILGISERTAVLHVNNAMHKLGCTSKHSDYRPATIRVPANWPKRGKRSSKHPK